MLMLALGAILCLQAPIYDFNPLPHTIATLGLTAVSGTLYGAAAPALESASPCRLQPGGICDPGQLTAWDRCSLGAPTRGWLWGSDIFQFVGIGLPILGAAMEQLSVPVLRRDAGVFGRDTLVGLESVVVASSLSAMLKFAVQRPRPELYASPTGGIHARLSFPSGHTTAAAAGATAAAVSFALHHPTSRWRWVMAGGALVVTGLTAYGRVAGGAHFPSDVVAGALVGGATGFVLPWTLRRRLEVSPTIVGYSSVDRQPLWGLRIGLPV